MNKCVIIGGGTFNHISCHLSLAAPAFGSTARQLAHIMNVKYADKFDTTLVLTKMAYQHSNLVTNDDVAGYVDGVLGDPLVKIIVMNAAICDFEIDNPSDQTRLSSQQDYPVVLKGIKGKILSTIKVRRPDIVVCGFKTTHGATHDQQAKKGVASMNSNNLNLVLANDVGTRENILISDTGRDYMDDRGALLERMMAIAVSRVKPHVAD